MPTVGSQLTATLTDDDGGVTGVSWQWARSLNSRSFTDIAGATASSYTPGADDVGRYLRVKASYGDSGGTGNTAENVMDCKTVTALESPEGVERSIQIHCGAILPGGIWSDGTTMWMLDTVGSEVFAYRLPGPGVTHDSGVTYDPTNNFDLAAGNDHPRDMWSDGTTIWVADSVDAKLYAYTRTASGATYDSTKDLALASDNGSPRGIWSDGTTLWVADVDNMVYAYTLTNNGATRDATRDFALETGNTGAGDIWSDGTTMWVLDLSDDKLYAYTLTDSGATYDSGLDISLADDNAAPDGIWSDGIEMWVGDLSDKYVYAYQAFDRPGEVRVSGGNTVGAVLTATLTDRDGGVTGVSWQWARSTNGTTFTDIAGATGSSYTSVAEDAGHHLQATALYSDAELTGRTAAGRAECSMSAPPPGLRSIVLHCENEESRGVWANTETVWVADAGDDRLYAYDIADRERAEDREIVLDEENDSPGGIWSDGTHVWVVDTVDFRLYAYRLADGTRDTSAEFRPSADLNQLPLSRGIWSDGATIWVATFASYGLQAYNLTTGARDTNSDIVHLATDNQRPSGLWSDGRYFWASDTMVEGQLFAYNKAERVYSGARDFDLHEDNDNAYGIGSDGSTTVWVGDTVDKILYGYAYPEQDGAPEFASVSVILTVAENSSPDADVGAPVTATDENIGDTLTYSLTGAGADLFAIDGNGQITVAPDATLDYETTASYTLTVTATDTADLTGTTTVTINVMNVDEAGTVTLSSYNPEVGIEQAATLSDPDGATSDVSWAWARSTDSGDNWTAISGATSAAYTPVAADVGALLRATASYTDPEGAGKSADAVSAAPVPDPPGVLVSRTTNSPTVGSVMTAELRDTDGGVTGLSWQWARSPDGNAFADIAGASAPSYTPSAADVGRYLRVTASYDDADAVSRTVERVMDCPAVDALEISGVRGSMQLHCDNSDPAGLWSDGAILWVSDSVDGKLYAYRLPEPGVAYDAGVTYVPNRDLAPAPGNDSAGGVWSDGATIWVADAGDDKLYAYTFTDGGAVGDPTKDIALAPGNEDPRGVWSDTTTLWVSDSVDDHVYAYTLTGAGATYDPTRSFDLAAGNTDAGSLWSDGATLWVEDWSGDKVYAYTLLRSGAVYNHNLDLDPVEGSTPGGIWSDGVDMWIADGNDIYVHAYEPPSAGSAIVSMTTNVPTVGSEMTAALRDRDGGVTGLSWHWARSTDGITFTDIPGADAKSYTPSTADVGRYLRVKASYDDADATDRTAESVSDCPVAAAVPSYAAVKRSIQLHCDNAKPLGLWSDGTTLWVLNWEPAKVYVYRLPAPGVAYDAGVTYDPTRDFALDTLNDGPTDLWSDGTTMWVTDLSDNKLYAYTLTDSGATRNPTTDMNLYRGNGDAWGIWSDGTTMWVSDGWDARVYTYTLTDSGADHDESKQFDLELYRNRAGGIWSDGTTLWVANRRDDTLHAYTLTDSGATSDSTLDLTLVDGATPRGLWSDGTDMWVVDRSDGTVHAYDLDGDGYVGVSRTTNVPTVGSVMGANLIDPDGGIVGLRWQWARSSNGTTFTDIAGAGASSYTPSAEDVDHYLRVEASYDDAVGTGRAAETVLDCPVVAAPPSYSAVTRSIQLHCDNARPAGLWSDGTTLWVVDSLDSKVYAYRFPAAGVAYDAGVTYDPTRDFALDTRSDSPRDLWSDGTTMWVADATDDKLYAYTLTGSGADLNPTRDITLAGINGDPRGVWSDGTTMWVSDGWRAAVYTYTLTDSGATRDESKQFDLGLDRHRAGQSWSDGTTMWVADRIDPELHAYTLTDSGATGDSTLDLTLVDGAASGGIWSDGTDMWVTGSGDKYVNAYDLYARAPAFASRSVVFRVAEDATPGTNVGEPVTATDASDDTVAFHLSGSGAGLFDIDDDGQITVGSGAELDYETVASYTLTVTATDTANLTATTVVTINVINLDEAGTVTLPTSEPSVGTALAATLSDPDGAASSVIWMWARSVDGGNIWTEITGATSAAYTPVTADAGALLRVTASYTDPEGPDKFAEAVTAAPVSNPAPVFPSDSLAFTVDENAPEGAEVGSPVGATDTGDDRIAYSLSGTDAGRFAIDSNGQITVGAGTTLDYEITASYRLTVTATDTLAATGTATVIISVTNVDEDGTVSFSSSQPQVGAGLTATLSDPDGVISFVSWVWARSADGGNNWTEIAGATSATYTPVSADAGALLAATASYTDPQGSGKSAGAVSAAPVLNPAPVFDSDSYMLSVAESAAGGTRVGSPVHANDPGDTVAYRLSGTGASLFDVDGDGQITVGSGATLDYETAPSYTLTVTATDTSNTTDTATLNISVVNVDEPGRVTLSSSRPKVGTGLTATLSDPDGATSSVSWVWDRSMDYGNNWTDIPGATSISYTPVSTDAGALLRATASYTDPEGPDKSADAVSVVPVSNPAPTFASASYMLSVAEDAAGGSAVGSPVTAIDPGDTVTYRLSGAGAPLFDIDGDGQITLLSRGTLDYETGASYTLTVTASDTSGGSGTATVNISVTNADEDGTVTFSSSQPQVGTELTATLSDPDGATSSVTWVWARSSNNGRSWSHIRGATSAGYTPVPADVDALLRASASYTDPEGSGKSARAVSSPVSNSAPVFAADSVLLGVAENAVAGTNVGSPVTATDPGDTIDYSLSGAGADLFDIDGDGQITLVSSGSLDYEATASYTLTVTATDTSNATDTATVNIGVINVDEDGTVSFSSTQPQVGTGLTATLSDPDGATSDVSWVWARSSNNGRSWSSISGATSSAYTPVPADAGALLRATASYTDPQGSGKSAEAVSAAPVSNTAPVFASASYTLSVAEDSAGGTAVGAPVTATDAGDTVTYRLSGTGASLFDVDGDGQITLRRSGTLDYEATASYTLTVTATDTSNATDTATVTINVANVDEDGTVSFSSSQPQVGTALTATLSDPDGTPSSVSWVWATSSNNGLSWTDISGATSAGYTPASADAGALLRASASYSDPEGLGKTADAVSVVPVSNPAPVFASASFTLSVAENSAGGTEVGAPVTAADPGDTVAYGLSGSGAGLFDIDSDGQITVGSGTSLDFETTRSYRLTVTATDTSSSTGTATVNIGVVNVDEDGTVTFSSSRPQVGAGLTATLSDLDGATRSVRWVWARSADGGNIWTDISGATSAGYTPVTADVGTLLRATASYTDPQGSGKSADAVQIATVSNPAPVFASGSFSLRVAENAAGGAAVGSPVMATDAGDDTLSYGLSGSGAGLFDIDSDGQITVGSGTTLDFETTRSYRLTVTATDTSSSTDTATVNIGVINVDEDGTVTLSSSQPQVGTGLTATLSDPDGATSDVSWVWAKSPNNGRSWSFISGATSAGYTPVPADAGARLRATASYTDPQGSGKSAEAVSAAPVSNTAPVFASASFTLSVAENSAGGTEVGSPVTAADPGDTVTYRLSGTGASLFDVDGDGQITVASGAELDYETAASYTLTVTATDTSSSTDTATVNIGVVNVDEDGTVTLSSSQPQVGTALTATLSDPDGTPSSVSWVWDRSTDFGNNWTDIAGATSISYTPAPADTGALLRATASYTDPEGPDKSADAVSVVPVSNSAPVFASASFTLSVAENSAGGTEVGSPVTAADPGDTVAYGLSGSGASLFVIDSDGQIAVASGASLDYETTRSYRLTVTATDTSSSTDTATVNIGVVNVDEDGTVTFSSSQPQVGTGLTATLSDPDGATRSVRWVWARSADGGNIWTDISGATSAGYTPVTADVGTLLRATASYTDPQGSGKSADAVQIATVSNPAPVFASGSFSMSVAENAAPGAAVGSPVMATDAGDDTLSYGLSGSGASLFVIDSSGQITVGSGTTLDFETTRSYRLTVTATDTSSSTDTATVNIGVINVDEDGTVTFSSTQPQVGTGLTATLSDPDGATSDVSWVWAKSSNNGRTWTDISGATSSAYTPVTADAGARLRATASYTDPQGSSKTADALQSTQVANPAPMLASDSVAFTVNENAAGGTRVGSPVTATDAGDDTVSYRLSGSGAALFDIDSSGQITVGSATSLDFETTASYTLTVTATDTLGASDTATVTIGVINLDEAGTVTLSSSQPQVGTGLTATLSDPDGATSSVSWVWARSSNNGSSWTNISGATSAAYTPVAADTGALLRATASYTDPQGSGKSAEAVSAAPVSNRAPVFASASFTLNVAENSAGGADVGSPVTAADPGDTVAYRLSGTGAFLFDIDSNGQVTLRSSGTLNHEATASFRLTVTATDTSNATDTATVNISVTNVDEAGTVSFSSAQPQAGTQLTATLSDLDGATRSVSWVWAKSTNNGNTWTDITGATSAGYTPVSADVDDLLRATASYTDPQGSGKSATAEVANAVQAEPLTNTAPVFASASWEVTVLENAAAGTTVGSPVVATDPDDTVGYSLSGSGSALFDIDGDGQITVASGATLDYETTRSYTLTVTATDTSNATDTATVTIEVTNVDEAGTVTFSSSQPQMGAGLTATLSDPDGATSSVTWIWARSSNNGSSWTDISGATSAAYTPVAADAGALLRATASYTDPEDSGKFAEAVSAAPVSNPAPVFASDSFTVSAAENATAGTAVGSPVTATDAGDDTLSYSLSGAGADLFDIDGDGQVTVASGATLDFETTRSYRLTVTATDTSSGTDTATLGISVTNVDEDGTVTLSSFQPQVGAGLTATLSDPDGATRSVSWVWARSSNNGGSWTDIGGARSAAYTPVTADVDALLRATASYTDPEGSGKSAEAVSAGPVSNPAPVFASGSFTVRVAENATPGTDVGSPVTAADAGDDTLSYQLSGSGADLFDIDGDGQITVGSGTTLDFETTASYTLTVTASDTSDSTDTATVIIEVTNVDEDGTVTLSSSQPQVGTGLTATLSDPDGATSSVSWVWARSSNNGGSWTDITGATSAGYTPVTADVGALLRATASYTDPQGSNKSAEAAQSTRVANPAPVFAVDSLEFTVNENAVAGTRVGSPVTATDAGDDTVSYRLSGAGASLFDIDGDGQITLRTTGTLDFETTASYTLTVTATDTSNATDTATVNISVTNVDEAGTVNFSSSQPQVGIVFTATFADPDGATSSVSWVWARSSNNGISWTNIGGATSAAYTPAPADAGALLRATASYTDPEGSSKFASAISAVPVANPAPVFVTAAFTLNVAEDATSGADVGSPVTATDPGDTVSYRLSGSGAALFEIDADGRITVGPSTTLDFETTASYTLTVTATDTSGGTAMATVRIGVTNVDEDGTVTLSSSQPPGRRRVDRDAVRSGRGHPLRELGVGQVVEQRQLLDGYQRCKIGRLHAGPRRRGRPVAGHGVVFRPARL